MDVFPPGYDVSSSTWLYLSAVLIVAVFFRFSRFWSLRNFDLCLLLSASPGLLAVDLPEWETLGYSWLFVVTGLFLVRVLVDPLFKRRPHLIQNLNSQGAAFLCVASFALLSMQAIKETLPPSAAETIERTDDMLKGRVNRADASGRAMAGPAAPYLLAPVGIVFEDFASRAIAVAAHLAVILGLLFLGQNLFGDLQLGLGMATLYLLLPCTAYDVGEVNHVLPSALIVWSLVAYRRPMVSGTLLGLACGVLFFPVFLLPLWAAFYGRRGALRFGTALLMVGAIVLSLQALTSPDQTAFLHRTIGTIHLELLSFDMPDAARGFWTDNLQHYRIPVIVTYFVMLAGLTVWPRKKTVEHLLAFSTALIVATQFWYPQQGGVYVLWYLPLLLAVMYRPRLVHLTPPQLAAQAAESRVATLSGPHPARGAVPAERTHRFR